MPAARVELTCLLPRPGPSPHACSPNYTYCRRPAPNQVQLRESSLCTSITWAINSTPLLVAATSRQPPGTPIQPTALYRLGTAQSLPSLALLGPSPLIRAPCLRLDSAPRRTCSPDRRSRPFRVAHRRPMPPKVRAHTAAANHILTV